MTADRTSIREALTDAIRYWEPRRILYNLVLAVVVGVHAVITLTGPGLSFTTDTALLLFLLWVLANVAYCAAYFADVPAQLSGFRSEWLRIRTAAFCVGVAFAAVLAHYFSRAILWPVI